jgi:hypothetical protein
VALRLGYHQSKESVLTIHKVEISELINSEWEQAGEPNPSRHKKNNSALND